MLKYLTNILFLVIFVVIASCKPDSPFTTVTTNSNFQLNVAECVHEGKIAILNGTHRVPSECPLDLSASKIKSGIKFTSYFNLDVHKLVPSLGDLKPKYIMVKKKNENIVYAIKAGDTLAFKLINFPK